MREQKSLALCFSLIIKFNAVSLCILGKRNDFTGWLKMTDQLCWLLHTLKGDIILAPGPCPLSFMHPQTLPSLLIPT